MPGLKQAGPDSVSVNFFAIGLLAGLDRVVQGIALAVDHVAAFVDDSPEADPLLRRSAVCFFR